MASRSPAPISPDESRRRHRRVLQLARPLGFMGRIEYRHVYANPGVPNTVAGLVRAATC